MDTKRMYRRSKRNHSRQKRQRKAIQSGTIFKATTESTVSTRSKKEAVSKERYLPHYKTPVTVKYINNKEAKFCNRNKTLYSIPTFKHLIETHINFIEKILRILPVSNIIIEYNKFDFQKLDRTQSTIKGYKSKEDYISHIQGGTCLLCKKSPIEHYHHIKFRSNRGSNNHYNLAGLCSSCHSKVHRDTALNHKLQQLKPGYTTKFSGTSVLNSCLPSIIERLTQFNIPVYTTTGEITSKFREEHNLPKDHHHDAYYIACSLLTDQKVFKNNSVPYLYIQYRRHNRA
ncbi:MAG: RRXRR domain-containing protein, partial [Prevotella sp.]|nr:RRXRR domain-containing protein [Prevotella sp.]